MDQDVNSLKNGLTTLGIEADDVKIQNLCRFYEMLVEKNKVMNLTAITEWEDVVNKHFIDSASLACVKADNDQTVYRMLSEGIKVCDLGTGAGFPGIPLAILFGESHFVLMDALRKRIDFLRDVVNELDLHNVELIHGRAEDLARDRSRREHYDICVSRAVSALNVLSEYCLPFVKVGGFFLSYKGEKAETELDDATRAIKTLGGGNATIHTFRLPQSDLPRAIIIIPKASATPKTYPRKAGTPERKPL